MKQKKYGAVTQIILWAVDPQEEATKPLAANMRQFSHWVEESGLEIQPISVISPTSADLETGLLARSETAKEDLERYLAGFQLTGLRSPKVVINEDGSRDGAVKRLLRFAAENQVAWIAVSSHGRSGIGRLVLGSFAEKLLAASEWPVLFLDHEAVARSTKTSKPVALFATDFSFHSQRAYRNFVGQAKGLGCEIVILNSLIYPMAATVGEGFCIPETYFVDQAEWVKTGPPLGGHGRRSRGIRALIAQRRWNWLH